MNTQTHWEKIYAEKAPDAVSWYCPHLETSLALIEKAAAGISASVIDVGGGESTLVDDLLTRGYENITVLDISQTAIDANKKRLGKVSDRVHWVAADITKVDLEPSAYDVWHDRAVFHFLTSPSDRFAYVRQVSRAVRPSGTVMSVPSAQRGQPSAAAWRLSAMTRSRCIRSLACVFGYSIAAKKCTAPRLGPSSNSSTVCAGSNEGLNRRGARLPVLH
jgi:ubiquinone/menaquinone biosynthesis C-methylase UbiE